MRLSKYMILYELVPYDKWLLIHGARGVFDIISDLLGKALSQIEQGVTSLELLKNQEYRFLADRGYIVSDSLDEDAYVAEVCRKIHNQKRKHFTVAFVPSYRCNFNCAYCFERGLRARKGSDFFKTVMSEDIVNEVFHYVDASRDAGREVTEIVLFGGEPLLPEHKKIIEWICMQCMQRNLPLSCVTNGYYLDEYIQTFRAFSKACIKTTLDGVQSVHDCRRAPASGSSFERVCKNIDAALDAGIKVGVRTNINRTNFDQINLLISFYSERRWTEKGNFGYYFKGTIPCLETECNRVSDVEIINHLGGKICGDCHNSIYNNLYRQLSSMLCQGHFAQLKAEYCGSHSGNITVDPFGNVFSCWDVMEREDSLVGQVDFEDGGITFHSNFTKWTEYTVDQKRACKECKYKLFCGGGCTAQSLMVYNDTEHAMCNDFAEEFREVATKIVKGQLCQKR